MIGKLTGIIDEIIAEQLILDVNGVGYVIYVPFNLLSSLNIGDKHSFYIHTYVREEILRLYGFANKDQLSWFLRLQEVPKVGAKLAFTILGSMEVIDLAKAIETEDVEPICKTPGIGKKAAMRIIGELKGKLLNLGSSGAAEHSLYMDAISALVNLSYSKDQAKMAVEESLKELGSDTNCAALVRASLRKLALK